MSVKNDYQGEKAKRINNTFIQIVQFVLLVVSLVLYYSAPKAYSLQFCIYCAVIFAISSFFLMRFSYRQSGSFINFDILFSIPFFYTNFVYSLFLYPLNPHFSLFRLEFNEEYICRGAALAAVAYCCYAFGRSIAKKVKKIRGFNVNAVKYKNLSSIYYLVAFIFIVAFLLPNLGKTYDEGSASYGIGNYVLAIVMTLTYYKLSVNLYSQTKNSLIGIYRSDRRFYLFFAIILALFALEGARTFLMRFSLVALFVYDLKIKRIKGKEALLLLVVGFILMAVIGLTRNGSQSSSEVVSGNPVIDAGFDLIINNRSLYVLMEYGDVHGYTYGQTLLMNIFSVVPFLQSIVYSLTSLSTWNTNSAYLVTDLYYSNSNEDIIGLGTNLVGDVYVMFGLVGLVIIMILFGRFISSLVEKVKSGDFVSLLVLAIMICNSVYYVRTSLLTPIRDIVWLLIVYYLCASKVTKGAMDSSLEIQRG